MLGKRPRGLQRSTSTSHVIEMAAITASSCPRKERARPPDVAIPPSTHILPNDRNNDIQSKSSDKLASPRSPLSVLQCLLTNYFSRKAEAGEPKTSVGLSIVIENLSHANNNNIMSPSCVSKMQILNKSLQVAPQCKQKTASSLPLVYNDHTLLSPLPAIDFLDACYLCKRSLGPGRDIYMYRGDRAFCSEECRWQQILRDERKEKCSSATATKPVTAPPSRRSGGHGHGHGHGHRHGTRGPGRAMATIA